MSSRMAETFSGECRRVRRGGGLACPGAISKAKQAKNDGEEAVKHGVGRGDGSHALRGEEFSCSVRVAKRNGFWSNAAWGGMA